MSLEDSRDTLPGIIKSLAEQLSSRDLQLKYERARHVDELSALKAQHDASLHAVRQAELQRSQLEEDLRQGKIHTAKISAAFDLEKVELLKRIELLQQAANHQADVLTQSRRELEAWKHRCTAVVENPHRQWEDWSSQLSQMTNRLNELAEVWCNSGSSPTVVASSLSPNKPASTNGSPHANLRSRLVVNSPKTTDQVPTPASATRRRTRSVHPDSAGAASERSIEESSPSRPRPREVSKAGVPNSSHRNWTSEQERQTLRTAEVPMPYPVKSPRSALAPDRVIRTAYFQVKQESSDDDNSDSSVSESLPTGADDDVTPSAKRKRPSMRKHRRIEDGDDEKEGADEARHQMRPRKRPRENEKEDYDEMAIGAEDNHKEVYGFRKIHVREVDSKPHNLTSQRRTSNLGGSSGTKRSIVPTGPAITNGTVKTSQ